MPYKYGNVYRIISLSHPEIQYVGSTFQPLRYRWGMHKSKWEEGKKFISIYEYFTKYGINDFKIVLIKRYLVYYAYERDRKHLNAYEQLWMNKLKCVNKRDCFVIPRLQKLKMKEYHKDHKEEIKKYLKEYHKEHKEEIKEYQKEYYKEYKEKKKEYDKEYKEKNKEHIKQKAKVKVTCSCGCVVNKNYLTRHKKTPKHRRLLAKSKE